MRRLTLRFPVHKPRSRSVVAGRLAHQKPSSILKMIKQFHQRNASTVIATYAATLIATTFAWIWMLVGVSKWAVGF
jgi:hypothetical protein